MVDGAALGTALIGQESVRSAQDLELVSRRREHVRDHGISPASVVRRGAARTLRALADTLEPAPLGRRTTPAQG